MSAAAASLGQRLKAERERRGLSAQKVADDLRLDVWVIEALESDDYARVGPSVYGKGHLKRYAGLLDLPTHEILEAYAAQLAAPAPLAQTSPRRMQAPTERRALPWATITGFALAAGMLAGLLWWRPWLPRSAALPATSGALGDAAVASAAPRVVASAAPRAETSVAPSAKQHVAPRAVNDLGVAAHGIADARATVAGATTAKDADLPAGLGRARLRLSFSADSWVDVRDAAGRQIYAGKGRANSVKTVAGAAPMKVYLGFASGVQLEVNERAVAIGPQFLAGDVARFEAGADGVLRRDAHPSSASFAPPRDVPAHNPHPRG